MDTFSIKFKFETIQLTPLNALLTANEIEEGENPFVFTTNNDFYFLVAPVDGFGSDYDD